MKDIIAYNAGHLSAQVACRLSLSERRLVRRHQRNYRQQVQQRETLPTFSSGETLLGSKYPNENFADVKKK